VAKVYGYIRVSTDTQAEKGYGLDTQRNAIEDYCAQHGLELVEVFRDEGISGTEVNREGLTDLLASLNGVKTVVVMNTSRLWRDDFAKVFVKREMQKMGAEVISIEQPTYSITDQEPNDYLVNAIMEALDNYERMSLNLKLAKGRRQKAKSGVKGGGETPLGYKWQHDPEGDKRPVVIIDDQTAHIIRDIYSQYLRLGTLGKVKDYCDDQGYITARGNNFSRQAIRNILTNDFYKGVVTHGDLKVDGQHEQIVSPVTFGKVQAAVRRRGGGVDR